MGPCGSGRTARSGTGFRCPDTEIRCQFVWAAGVRAACPRGPLAEIRGFYRNYHSIRWIGSTLVIRLRATPTADEVTASNDEFGGLALSGGTATCGPTPAERADDDHLDLARIVIEFDFTRYGRLRALIDALNRLGSAPTELSLPPGHGAHL